MRKTFLFFCLLSLITTVAFSQKGNRFAIKSGHVEYKLTGNTTGTKSLWFDDYGYKSFVETNTKTVVKMFDVKDETTEHKIVIMEGALIYSIDLASKKGTKMENEYYGISQELVGQMTDDEQEKMGKDILNSMGGKIIGTGIILGNSCDIVEVLGSKSWIHKGVVLKSESKIMGIEENETATKFDKNITIAASKFEPPTGIVIEEITHSTNDLMMGNYDENGEYIDEESMSGNDEETDIIAVSYPFESFKKVILDFNPEGYTRGIVMNQEGQHFALYMQGMGQMMTVIATAEENIESNNAEFTGFEEFTHNGRTMRYGVLEEEGTTSNALLIKYPSHDMYIILMAVPANDKTSLLNWADDLGF